MQRRGQPQGLPLRIPTELDCQLPLGEQGKRPAEEGAADDDPGGGDAPAEDRGCGEEGDYGGGPGGDDVGGQADEDCGHEADGADVDCVEEGAHPC